MNTERNDVKHVEMPAGDVEPISDEIIDLEEYARQGKKPPRAKSYRFKVNNELVVVDHPVVTGREVLTLAGLMPPERYTLRVKIAGHKPEKIGLDEKVDLRRPGIEKFKALPVDQTEGYDSPLRREFELPIEDREFLDEYGCPWETTKGGSHQWVLIHDFPTDERYNYSRVTVAIQLQTGYPRTPLDMAYFSPPLQRKDGLSIQAIADQPIDGKTYQRWSRHRTAANPWIVGLDNIGTHIILIEDWLAREFRK